MLPGTRDDDDIVLAGSPHAHICARWIPARLCPCLLDPRPHTLTGCARTHAPGPHMHAPGPCMLARTGSPCPLARRAHAHMLALGPHTYSLAGPISHARTGSPRPLGLYARTHRVPMPARSWGPHASTHRANHARSHRAMHACTGSLCPLTRRVPTQACTGPCMHARTGPCLHACTGPCLHARTGPCTHARSPCMHAPGPCAHAHSGSPCMRAPGLMHVHSHRAPMPACLRGSHARAPDPCTCACCIPYCM